jgi:hypothetical protein
LLRVAEARDQADAVATKKRKKVEPKRAPIKADDFPTYDREVIKSLELMSNILPEVIELYAAAVEIAEIAPSFTQYGEQVSTSSGYSDPVGNMASDPRRSQRNKQIKEARKSTKAALKHLKAALYWSASASG